MDAAQERINERVAAGPAPEPSLTIRGTDQVRAALTAINSHEELVAALRWIVNDAVYKAPEQHNELSLKYVDRASRALDALAKAQA